MQMKCNYVTEVTASLWVLSELRAAEAPENSEP